MLLVDLAAGLRRPEYTGENRCVPCTLLNVLVAGALAGAVAWAGTPGLGAVTFAGGAVVIYLRGYLVPGTPTITRRYFPDAVLDLFGKGAAGDRSAHATPGDLSDAADGLFAGGILTAAGDDARLDEEFRAAWRARVDDVRERDPGASDVTAMLDAERCEAHGDLSFVVDGDRLVRWASGSALVADVAAADALRTRFDGWAALDRSERLDLLTGLRLFLDRCPACDGPVSTTERRVESCCKKPFTAVTAVCEACGATLAEVSVPADGEGTVRRRFLES